MKIIKLELKNFKRFDELTIDLTSLPEPAKLVLLIGANGSGKSSVFDAFEVLNKPTKNEGREVAYYNKQESTDNFSIVAVVDRKDQSGKNIEAKVIAGKIEQGLKVDSFYGRTSVRQVPKLTRTSLGQNQIIFERDSDRPRTFIERDNRFENDIEKVASSILTDVFNSNTSTEAIRESYINPINKSFQNIFSVEDNTRLKLISIKPPLDGKTAEILFKKGQSTIPYDYLSNGEKEIFNILLNFLTRSEYFKDTVYFLDEIDLHLNTALQKSLLKEITENWIPDNCQLWIASHSLGFIDYANEAENAAIIDFDNLDFDFPQMIYPSAKKSFDVFEIAVSKEFLSNIFEGKIIVFAENKDAFFYNNLKVKDTIFVAANNKAEVFYKVKGSPIYRGLIDRDYLTDTEREQILKEYQNLYILKYYSSENYLYHPDNLQKYYESKGAEFDKEAYITSLKQEKKLIRDKVLLGVLRARESYSFFRELKPKIAKDSEELILQMLDSEDFETFYRVFPAKDYGTQIKERQNLNPADLAKTFWFKAKIEEVLQK